MRITMTDWIHRVLDEYIKEGDCCVDATAGNGNDTAVLMQRWEKVETPIICAAKQEKAEKSTPLMCRQMH